VNPIDVPFASLHVTIAAVLLASALALNSLGALCQEPTLLKESDGWARPLLVVAPSFPNDFRPEMLPVEIHIEGIVTEKGTFESPVFSPAPGREIFVQSVSGVIKDWRFRPALDAKECKTKESRVSVNVYFELKDGQPSISVSSPVVTKPDAGSTKSEIHIVRRGKTQFPPLAFDAGIEGSAELLTSVDARGEAVSTTVVSSLPNELFGKAAVEGFARAKYSEIESTESPDKMRCATILVKFCIRDSGQVRYHSPNCHD
jgi:outer membrane biosynthesis protein TonB